MWRLSLFPSPFTSDTWQTDKPFMNCGKDENEVLTIKTRSKQKISEIWTIRREIGRTRRKNDSDFGGRKDASKIKAKWNPWHVEIEKKSAGGMKGVTAKSINSPTQTKRAASLNHSRTSVWIGWLWVTVPGRDGWRSVRFHERAVVTLTLRMVEKKKHNCVH